METAMRKAFNFYKSFYDVYKELNKNEKVEFMDALLMRQFEGIEPTKLKGMAKFAYKSQEQVINQQIQGWETKTGNTLNASPTQGGLSSPRQDPSVQEEGKGEEKEQVQEEVQYIVTFLNKKSGKNFSVKTDKTKSAINARLSEGFKRHDFEKVIITKVQEWNNTDMEKYIRPETLFGTKFESYLNQKINTNQSWKPVL